MSIRRLSVKNVRSHQEKVIDLSPNTTVLVGKNGIGKTTLLEAICIALRGVSFKGSDSDILHHEAPWYRIDMVMSDDTVRSVTYDPSLTSGKKKFNIHSKTSYRMLLRDKYPYVLFEPEDLRLLHGSPSRRRQFVDHFITQIDPTYTTILRKYERSLKQRNTLLKKDGVTNDDLFVWNVALSDYGAMIIERRIYAIETINKQLGQYYNQIANTNDIITVHYSDTLIGDLSQKLLRELEAKLPYDKIVGHTSVGPHRHDVLFNFNNSPALTVASRGEVRTILLAVKQTEAVMIKQLTDKTPIILLDDVFSELDTARQESVIGLFEGYQVVISSALDFEPIKDTKIEYL